MAGLTAEGFVPKSLQEISSNIAARLEEYNPGFDVSPESPDGQLISIVGAVSALLWDELNNVYHSYDPNAAFGQGLRNIGTITGLMYQVATRSSALIGLTGVAGTVVPEGSLVSDLDGNQYYTNAEAVIPADVSVLAVLSGPTPILAGALVNIESVVFGWNGITQVADGVEGRPAQSEQQYRNMRNRTVMRNSVTIQETMEARLTELGIPQILVVNNDTDVPLADGTPARNVHVTIGEYGGITDETIAQIIFDTKGLGVVTYGSTSTTILDNQGFQHTVSFSKSVAISVSVLLSVTYLDDETAGATERIKTALVDHINGLLVGEDVIWSRLFEYITPYGKAQINSLQIGLLGTEAAANFSISDTEYALVTTGDINISVV